MSVTITSTDSPEAIKEILDAEGNRNEPKDTPAASPEGDKSTPDSATGEGNEDDANKPDPDPDANKGDQDPAAKPPAKADKRIDKVTKEKSDAERERDYWKQVALEGKAPPTEKAPDKKPKDEAKEPSPDDFENPTDYYKALVKYEGTRVREAVKAEILAEQKATKDAEQQNKVFVEWEAKMVEARTRYADFDEVTNSDLPITPIVQETFLTSPVGTDLAYWWGKHPEEVKNLVKLAPLALARRLGQIEAGLEVSLNANGDKDGGKQTPRNVTTPKPKPMTPVGGSGGGSNVQPDEDKMSYTEYKAHRMKQLNRRLA